MVLVNELENYANQLLGVERFKDYCPNGVQVEGGKTQVRRILSGVTASLALIERAVQWQADVLLVHHGWFWPGEPAPLVGMKGRRLRCLLAGDISLLAYHLPLDAHPQLGNNRLLGDALGFSGHQPEEPDGLLWGGELTTGETPAVFAQRIHQALDRPALHLPGGPANILRVAWCSGGAEGMIEQAAKGGYHAFISGEVAEPTMHLASELGIHYYAAGHHATERFGVQALGAHLAQRFDLDHQFVDLTNPV